MSRPDNIALHAADPAGREGYVLLIFAPGADGRVRVREWSSVDYTAPGREGWMTPDELTGRVHEWTRAGWTLTESPIRIAAWLAGRG